MSHPRVQFGRYGIKTFSVVGYTHAADTWCNDCADEMGLPDDPDARPIFADSEWDYRPTCGGCLEPLPHVTVMGEGATPV